jgi:parvulin-like peptidyl-prolyl isomerase
MLFVCSLVIFSGCKEKDNIIAKVGKDTVTTDSFSEKLMSAPPAYQAYINTEPGKKQFVDLLVREKLILESAKQAAINKREEYKKALNDFKQEQEKQLKDYEDGLMIEMYLKEVQENIAFAKEDEINKYYEEHKQDFTNPIAVTAKHILVSTKEEAKKALDRLNKGEKFDIIAKEMSTDKVSAQKGGLIGPFRKGELVKEFEDVVFNLKKGEVSDIVETPFGFHIITKVSEEKLQPISEDVAKAEIKGIIEKTKFEKWFEDIKKKFNVVVDYSKLDKVKESGAGTADSQQENVELDQFSN